MNFEDCKVIKPCVSDLPLVEEIYIYEGQITPNRMIIDKQLYEIVRLDQLWVLSGFAVTLENGKMERITIFGHHPNKDWKTGLYCMPERKIGLEFNKTYFDMLMMNIKTYYLNDCHTVPYPSQVTYRKLKSMYIQLNQGDDDG